uniref:RNA-dependent RNA polymerase n=1 Tax=Macrophomina phaseolina partitivirus 2 TaxID=2741647 RepID=A0A7S6BCA3_9VIRU|nr:RNA-dependent RNA polymerase [Macrophomina phaseolina partitivirus 2]
MDNQLLENVVVTETDLAQRGFEDGLLDPTLFSAPSRETRRKQSRAEFISTEGLSEVARWAGYQQYQPPGNVDPWVSEAMKQYDRSKYDDLKGYTRRGEALPGMYKSLKKYEGTVARFTDFSERQRQAMVRAIGKARSAFRTPEKMQPYRPHQVGQHIKTDTSAGFTFPGLRKKDCMEEIYQEARWLAHRIKSGGRRRFDPRRVRFAPCLAGSRGHLSPRDDVKTRLVWVYPAEMLVVEGLFAPIIYNGLATLPNGPLMLGKSSQRLFSEWLANYKEGEILHGLDFSAFDTHVPPWLIHVAFDILKQNIDFEYDGNVPNTKKGQIKLSNLWNAVVWYFINTPILMPDGRMFRKRHGVPSGSYFTQLIDSVVSYILISYVCDLQGLEPRNLKVLGDDSQFRSPFSLDLDRAQSDCDACAMNLSVVKCEQTKDPTQFKSLGLRYKNSHGYRDDDDWFKFAIYPEQPPPDLRTSMSRLVGLWLGGAMFSKAFVSFFEYYQSCYPVPSSGQFSKEQRRWMEIQRGGRAPLGWSVKTDLFWRSIFYTL